MKRRRLPAAERRASILSAAREVFVAEGFVGARTRLIADRAGINEAVLYQHFESKEELFEAAVLEPLLLQVHASADRIASAVEGVDRADRAALIEAVEAEILRSVISMLPLMGVALFSGRRAGERFYRERLHPTLEGAVRALAERLGLDGVDVRGDILVTALVAGSLGPALDADSRSRRLQATRIGQQFATLLVHGLSSPPRISTVRSRAAAEKRTLRTR